MEIELKEKIPFIIDEIGMNKMSNIQIILTKIKKIAMSFVTFIENVLAILYEHDQKPIKVMFKQFTGFYFQFWLILSVILSIVIAVEYRISENRPIYCKVKRLGINCFTFATSTVLMFTLIAIGTIRTIVEQVVKIYETIECVFLDLIDGILNKM